MSGLLKNPPIREDGLDGADAATMTLDQLGAKMRCEKCGKRPERLYAANHSDTSGFVRTF